MGASAASAATWELVSITTKSSNGNAALTLSGDLTFETDVSNNLIANGKL
jgi:hypothetical protein